jgi:hypothetical protein
MGDAARPIEIDAYRVEDFWDDLLAFVEQRRVIPVLGAELLQIREDGATIPLYQAVAGDLLQKYKLPLPAERCSLYEAVSALIASNRVRVRDLYRPVHDILQRRLARHPETLGPLLELAAIDHFDLFVTTTPDDLMARAINQVRFDRAPLTHEIEYAPKLPTERLRDVPAAPSSAYAAVFYLFGKADVSPYFAIHEEDALEFPYLLQTGSGPERMFSQMRTRNLLLIGCTFADWLSRFFLRLSNTDRLSSDHRTKKEYLVGQETARDQDFVVFLERFSQDSRCYPIDAVTFATELASRWQVRNPPQAAAATEAQTAVLASGGTIFISYAKEDFGAAAAVFEELSRIGDVAWFDKRSLRPGDEWERHIAGAIQKCGLFLPLLSKTTERRTDGFFIEEWKTAARLSNRVQGRRFILPIVIDADYGGQMDRYQRVPEQFKGFQYSHAPAGRIDDVLRDTIREELKNFWRGKP